MNTVALKIEKILSIEDTRQYEEVSADVFKPIPGSGLQNPCARCGRIHDIQVSVKLNDGHIITVGTGCMTKGTVALANRYMRAENAAKKRAALNAKLVKAEAYSAAYAVEREAIKSLGFPEVTSGEVAYPGGNSRTLRARMGDASVCYFPATQEGTSRFIGGFDAERAGCLKEAYLGNRLVERGFRKSPLTNGEIENLRHDIRKVEKALSEF